MVLNGVVQLGEGQLTTQDRSTCLIVFSDIAPAQSVDIWEGRGGEGRGEEVGGGRREEWGGVMVCIQCALDIDKQ